MSRSVIVSPAAGVDLRTQSQWYQTHADLEVAARYLEAVSDTVDLLRADAELGRPRAFAAKEISGVRSMPLVGRFRVHLLFYRFNDEAITVVRVLHGACDLPRRLVEPRGDEL